MPGWEMVYGIMMMTRRRCRYRSNRMNPANLLRSKALKRRLENQQNGEKPKQRRASSEGRRMWVISNALPTTH
jgi:hypothetical protein